MIKHAKATLDRFTWALVITSLSFISLGWLGYNQLLSENRCSMTYSSPQFGQIKFNSVVGIRGYSLWQSQNSNDKLLAQPVLFIHGHNGRMNQVRSFASEMHNNGSFQYFSVDIREKSMAYHGSSIVYQSVFVNEAIQKIQLMYSESFPKAPVPRIILLGHSLGGKVARTAMFLSNHPSCAVSTIITLGTPHHKSTYSPDVSQDTLVQSLSKAWRSSYFHASTACAADSIESSDTSAPIKKRIMRKLNRIKKTNGTDVADTSGYLTSSWSCSRCVPLTTVISITGGISDMYVPAPLTVLSTSIPKPNNRSAHSPTPKKVRKAMMPEGGFVRYLTRLTSAQTSLVMESIRAALGLSTANATAGADTMTDTVTGHSSPTPHTPHGDDEFTDITNDAQPSSGPPRNESIAANVSAHTAFLQSVTQDQWNEDIVPYSPPHQLSLRTSQLAGVGFPVDHLALVWCFELLHVITDGLHRLSRSDVSTSDVLKDSFMSSERRMEKAFPLHDRYQPTGVPEGLIDPMEATLRKDAQLKQWLRASDDEKLYLARTLTRRISDVSIFKFSRDKHEMTPDNEKGFSNDEYELGRDDDLSVFRVLGTLWAVAVVLVTSHISTVSTCYVICSILMLSVPIWRGLANVKPLYPTGRVLHLVSPWVHSHLALIWPYAIDHLGWIYYYLDSYVPHRRRFYGFSLATILSSTIMLVLANVIVFEALSVVHFMRRYGFIIEWVVCYGAALGVRAVLTWLLRAFSTVISQLLAILYMVCEWTIWNSYFRKMFRKVKKYVLKSVPMLSYFISIFDNSSPWIYSGWMMIILGLVLSINRLWTGNTLSPAMTSATALSAQIYIILFSTNVVVFSLTTLVSYTDDDHAAHVINVTLLYLPVIPLAIPSLIYCYSLMYGTLGRVEVAVPLLDMFLSGVVYYDVVLFVVLLHMTYVIRMSLRVRPAGWVVESVGSVAASPGLQDRAGVDGTSTAVIGPGGWRGGLCVHEDGGVNAVYEHCLKAAVKVSPGVFLGPAFRVLTCACEKDRRLKSSELWCDWCRCPRCGARDGNRRELLRKRTFSNYDDLSADLGLGFVIVILAACSGLFASDHPYRQLYILGLVAMSFHVHRVATWFGL